MRLVQMTDSDFQHDVLSQKYNLPIDLFMQRMDIFTHAGYFIFIMSSTKL